MSYPLMKAFHYIGLAALLGGPAFFHLIWKPTGLAGKSHMSVRSDEHVRRTVPKVMLCGLLLLSSTGMMDVVRVTREFYGVVEWEFFQYELFRTPMGRVILTRLALGIVFMVLGARSLKRPRVRQRFITLFLGLGLIVTVSVISHQAGKGTFPIITDVLHLLATALWGGGLLYFAFIPSATMQMEANGVRRLGRIARRFSRLGLGCVAILAMTGIYISLLHFESIALLVDTSYGLALLRKLAIFGMIIAIAAVHHFYFVPALHKGDARGAIMMQRFMLLVRLEAAWLLILLIAVGFLTTNMPPHPHF